MIKHTKNYLLLICFLIYSQSMIGQRDNLSLGVHYGISQTSLRSPQGNFGSFVSTFETDLEYVQGRTHSYGVELGTQVFNKMRIIGGIGLTGYSVSLSGTSLPGSGLPVVARNEKWVVRFMDVQLHLEYTPKFTTNFDWVFQGGGSWYTNPKRRLSNVGNFFYESNSFAANGLIGIQTKLFDNLGLLKIGALLKVPLNNYNRNFMGSMNNLEPLSIGLRITAQIKIF